MVSLKSGCDRGEGILLEYGKSAFEFAIRKVCANAKVSMEADVQQRKKVNYEDRKSDHPHEFRLVLYTDF